MATADSNALTLVEQAVMSNDPLVMKITESLLINGAVFTDLPLVNKKSMKVNGVRWEGNLPTVTWNKLNAGTTVTKGKPTPYQEQAYLVRNAIDVDIKILEDENNIVDPRSAQAQAWLRSLTYDYNDKFINNDHIAGDDDAFVGLRYRIDNYTTYGVNSDMKIDASGVDMTASGMTSSTANTFIEYVQQVLDYMGAPDGDGVVFYLNDVLKRRWERAIRLMGAGAGFDTTRDAFDRAVSVYRNAKIVDVGRKADQSTRIITTTETSAGVAGASNYTSMYAVRYGEDLGMIGWQYDSLPDSINDIGLVGNDGTVARTVIDWAHGILPMHTRCMARLYDIKVS